jgi:hypothetical protein
VGEAKNLAEEEMKRIMASGGSVSRNKSESSTAKGRSVITTTWVTDSGVGGSGGSGSSSSSSRSGNDFNSSKKFLAYFGRY